MDELNTARQIAGLQIRRVPIASLHLDPANARSHPDANMAAIEASLRRFGQAEPLIVQAKTGRVIGGNGRLVAMRKLDWDACDVVELEVDDLTATSLGIALNRTGELAEWNEETLAQLLKELKAEDALDGIGFSPAEVDKLLDELLASQGSELEDPGPGEPPEHPVTKLGDLWVLDSHRLLCGDSLHAEHMARLMAGATATLLSTDPPYHVNYDGTNHPYDHHRKAGRKAPEGGELGNKCWDAYEDPQASVEFFATFLRVALAHCVERIPVYQWHASKRQSLVEQAWEQNGLLIHQTLIWSKPRGVLTRSMYLWQHEPGFFGWPKGKMPEKDRRPPTDATTVWPIDQTGNAGIEHPTVKPVEIFERPIRYHTRSGELVLEPFSGSGTQIIASERLGRRCRAMELAPSFVDVAVERWQTATGKQAVLEATGQTFAEIAKERAE